MEKCSLKNNTPTICVVKLRDASTFNPYLYCAANPIMNTDPTGKVITHETIEQYEKQVKGKEDIKAHNAAARVEGKDRGRNVTGSRFIEYNEDGSGYIDVEYEVIGPGNSTGNYRICFDKDKNVIPPKKD